MGASGAVYKMGPDYHLSSEVIIENDKWGFLTTKKFDELADKGRIVSTNGDSCEFAMVVNMKELNAMFEECGDYRRVKDEYSFYLIVWDV